MPYARCQEQRLHAMANIERAIAKHQGEAFEMPKPKEHCMGRPQNVEH